MLGSSRRILYVSTTIFADAFFHVVCATTRSSSRGTAAQRPRDPTPFDGCDPFQLVLGVVYRHRYRLSVEQLRSLTLLHGWTSYAVFLLVVKLPYLSESRMPSRAQVGERQEWFSMLRLAINPCTKCPTASETNPNGPDILRGPNSSQPHIEGRFAMPIVVFMVK
nr:hypothetical protein CFP56_75682 [Quercus suber]